MAAKQISDRLVARPTDGRFRVAEIDPSATPGLKKRRRAKSDLEEHQAKLFDLQGRLYAEHKRSLLIVLQAMDTGGKDGTVTHVIGHVNPQAVSITSFKAPTPEEKRHNFLWRIRRHLPSPGYVGIFNRSHYEDVLVARVHNLAPPEAIERRYGQINEFERNLVQSGTKVVKFMLHISYEEQRQRLIDRLCGP